MTADRLFKYWLPVFVWMGFIFWMSTGDFSSDNTSLIIGPLIRFFVPGISDPAADLIHGVIRKCGHVSEYFVLGLLLFRAFRSGSGDLPAWRCAAFSVIVVVLYAASDEFHQSFVAVRTASPLDVGFDTLGGVLAQVVSVLYVNKGKR